MTTSPQPPSPSNNYNNHNNTPSPYSMGGGMPAVGNSHLLPQSHMQYNVPVGAGGGRITVPQLGNPPSPMDTPEYTTFVQQQQQPQHQHQHQHQHQLHQQSPHPHDQQHQQQQYQNISFGGAAAAHWEARFAATTAVNANMSNLNSPFIMQNLVTAGTGGGGAPNWNLAPNLMELHQQQQRPLTPLPHPHPHSHTHPHTHPHPHPHMQPQQLQQQHYQPVQNESDVNPSAGATEQGPTLSNLLSTFDSEQLLRINSDELQISNLSIST